MTNQGNPEVAQSPESTVSQTLTLVANAVLTRHNYEPVSETPFEARWRHISAEEALGALPEGKDLYLHQMRILIPGGSNYEPQITTVFLVDRKNLVPHHERQELWGMATDEYLQFGPRDSDSLDEGERAKAYKYLDLLGALIR